MGHSIVYCDQCGTLLREEDFRKGKAHTAENRSYCAACRPLPEPPRPPSPPSARRLLPAGHATPARPFKRPSSKGLPPVPPLPPRRGRSTALWAAVAGGGLLLVAVVVAVASAGKPAPPASTGEIRMRPTAAPAAPAASAGPEDAAARMLLAGVLEFKRRNERNPAAQLDRFERARKELAGTAYIAELERWEEEARRRIAEEIEGLDRQAAASLAADAHGSAVALWEAGQARYERPEWTGPAARKLADLRKEVDRQYAELAAKAVEARRRDASDEVAAAVGRVARWNIPALARDLDRALEAARPPPTAAAAPPPPDKTAESLRLKLAEASAHAAARDFDAALAVLEKEPAAAAEVARLRLARDGWPQALALAAKWPKGRKTAVDYRSPSGEPARVEDVLLRADAHRLELRSGEGTVVVPLGEILATTFAGLLPAAEAMAAVEASAAPSDPDAEAAARALFYAAEAEYFDPARALDAVAKYRRLVAERSSTAFVRRNRGAIEARLEPPKDVYFFLKDMDVSGGFKEGGSKKVDACWTSVKDVEPQDRGSAFVEIAFPAGPEAAWRAWILAGGCCLEVFTFTVQGTEMTAPDPANPKQTLPAEPGTDVEAPVKVYVSSLKKRHEDHIGPKEPARWEWLPVPLPKYAKAGTQRLRILTGQKGFSVAGAYVSSTRSYPPSDTLLRAAERERAETPGWTPRTPSSFGTLIREWWEGGGDQVGDLTRHPDFPHKPAGRENVDRFASPRDFKDDYGTRLRGYLVPPASGEYTFWIAADDRAELWLSDGEDPARKRRIASVPEWTDPEQWDKHDSQKSAPIRLEAGRRYYVEALQKEGGGGDHVSVMWQLPDGRREGPIPARRLIAPRD